MNKPLLGVKAAMLVANGFSQQDMVAAQKALIQAGANVRVISPESGLVNGWEGEAWGHHFAVDAPLSSALGADYAVLVVPGGQRSIEKMNLTGHTRRFITSFMESGKPVAVMDDALHILILTGNACARKVSGPESLHDIALQAGAEWSGKGICIDGCLMSGAIEDGKGRDAFIAALMDHVSGMMALEEQAA